MPDFDSPNVGNYSVPKGNLYWTPAGGERRHLGNCPAAEFTMEVETLEHFSSMVGVRTKDFTATLGKTGSLAITLDEITLANLQLALLGGEVAGDTDGNNGFEIGLVTSVTGRVEIIGSGDIGPKFTADFPSVQFNPSAGIPFISDEDFAQIELEGEVNAVNGSFGRLTLQDTSTEEPATE
jgi:hypothetical protein